MDAEPFTIALAPGAAALRRAEARDAAAVGEPHAGRLSVSHTHTRSLVRRPRRFNGGPGCSSLEGGFSESGLYRVQEFTSPPQLGVNPFSWGNKTNNIFMEAPAGVGFSYCDTAAGCKHTDTAQAVDNLAAIKDFFGKFPELAKNDFWITGESYAGIYIPTLAQQVIEDNAKSPAVPINLKGILVGNGCIGNEAGHCGNDPTGLNDYHDIQIWRGHALVSETNYDNIMKNCVWDNQRCVRARHRGAATRASPASHRLLLYLFLLAAPSATRSCRPPPTPSATSTCTTCTTRATTPCSTAARPSRAAPCSRACRRRARRAASPRARTR